MPRSTFAINALSGATPGLSRLAASLGGGQTAYQGAYDQGMTAQSKIAQALAAINASNASADAHRSIATQNDAETGILTQRPAELDRGVAYQSGAPLPLVNAVKQFFETGVRPMKPSVGPATEDGTDAAPFPVVDDATQSKIAQLLGRTVAQRTNLKDTSPDDLAKATGEYRAQDLGDAVLAGRVSPAAAGRSQAAVGAKPLYHFGENGIVGDLFGGGINESGGLAQGNIALKGAQAGEQRAAAAHQYAGANAQNASAAKTRSDMTLAQTAPKGVLQMTDQGLVLVDPRAATSVPVTGTDGQPLTQKLKPIPPQVNTAIISNAQNLNKVQQAIDLLEGKDVGTMKGDKNGTGLKAYAPQGVVNVLDPQGVDARAAVSDLGSLVLHDRSGAAVTVSEMPRLAPFIPLPTDQPAAALKKLRRFMQNYQSEAAALAQTYSKEQGYTPSPVQPTQPAAKAPGAAAPASDADYNALPSGSTYTAPDGTTRTKR